MRVQGDLIDAVIRNGESFSFATLCRRREAVFPALAPLLLSADAYPNSLLHVCAVPPHFRASGMPALAKQSDGGWTPGDSSGPSRPLGSTPEASLTPQTTVQPRPSHVLLSIARYVIGQDVPIDI